ncbi:hypothetical protein JOM56_011007 [Amanita muscaria]
MPPTLSEDEINALVESLTDDNFFEKCLALNPEDSDHVNSVKAAQFAFNSRQGPPRASLMTVSASNGWLAWRCDGKNGRGMTNGITGSGNFWGHEVIPGHVPAGTFRLTFNGNSTSLFLSGGFTWRGAGSHTGLHGQTVSGSYS